MNFRLSVLFCFVVALPASAQQVLESDWLKPSQGSQGEKLGAEVERIQVDDDRDRTVIDISLPLDRVEHIDQVEVISLDKGLPMQQLDRHQWLDDYEKGEYGLRVFLKRYPTTGFRIRLIDADDGARQQD